MTGYTTAGSQSDARKPWVDRLSRVGANIASTAAFVGLLSVELGRYSARHGWLPVVPATIIALGVLLTATYWFQPQPRVSFSRWVSGLLLTSSVLVAAVWPIPILLSRLIWLPIADGLPVAAAVFLLYLLPTPFRPAARKIGPVEWALFSLVLGLLFVLSDLFVASRA